MKCNCQRAISVNSYVAARAIYELSKHDRTTAEAIIADANRKLEGNMSERTHINQLPIDVQKALMEAFHETGYADVYEGDVVKYLHAIKDKIKKGEELLKATVDISENMRRAISKSRP